MDAGDDQPVGIEAVALMRPRGHGWILWDATFAAVTAGGGEDPVLARSARQMFEWARARSAAGVTEP